jgi:tetratricopeptide (TPR) repeat protein
MNWHHLLTTSTAQVILFASKPGEARDNYLQQQLDIAQHNKATTWFLSCNRDQNGPWAGLADMFSDIVPQIQKQAPDLISKHDYELVAILPALRRTISVRNPNLTDTSASKRELSRNYPADRAFRIVHGLVDLFYAWYQRLNTPLVIACDRFDSASVLVNSFFVELIRRHYQHINLTLVLAINSEAIETVAARFDTKYLGECIQLNLEPSQLDAHFSKQEMTKLAQKLEQQVGQDVIEQEIYLPQLIHSWLLSDQPEKALPYQIQAFSTYTERGFYEDALVYGEAALENLERYCSDDLEKRLQIYGKLYGCYASLHRPIEALEIAEATIAITDDPNHLFQWRYMLAMLQVRSLPERDLVKAEAYLEQGLSELAQTNHSEEKKAFYTSFIRNGLALIRHRQGRADEAIAICRSCYEQLNTHLKPDQHRLHRSVLLYNIAQVYTAIGLLEEAVSYLTLAMEMDPNYSEYYNDRGNLYMKMGRIEDALNDYFQAIELSPPYWEVWSNLGQCYRMMGQLEKAIAAYSNSLDLDPQVSVMLARAEIYELLEQPNAALLDYSTAIALSSDQAFVLANRAILYYQVECYQEALDDLNQAIKLSPDTPDLYENRAIALTTLGREEEAQEDYQTYLELSEKALA